MDQLRLFIGLNVREEDGFFALKLTPAGAWPSRVATGVTARPAVCQASGGAQVASPQSPILRRSTGENEARAREGNRKGEGGALFRFCSHRPVRF